MLDHARCLTNTFRNTSTLREWMNYQKASTAVQIGLDPARDVLLAFEQNENVFIHGCSVRLLIPGFVGVTLYQVAWTHK